MSVYCISLLLAQLCALVAARVAGSNAFRSDYTYWPDAEGWLKLHREPLDWHSARVQCYHEGAVLASPLNAGLQIAMTKILGQTEISPPFVFSGVSATLSDGLFSSVEGIPIEQLFIKWPTDYNGQNEDQKKQCLVYNSKLSPTSFYNCKQPLPYFCYRKFSITDELTDCGTVDKEYRLDTRTGHCYKFHRHRTTWARAARVCQAEGGHLAVIDSQTEAELLGELLSAQLQLLCIPYTDYEKIAVGFKKWGNDNSWWTIHGKLLEDSGYSSWGRNQPNNIRDNEACGSIFVTGQLAELWCEERVFFICEKSPNSLTTKSPSQSPQ